ncbi:MULTISPECIES: nicotinate-nucleotide--dimethylbenzimidazole phosphoribosyltransferase [unclassified Acinetobacter]|uniref:nicotinate-nucleotide--dimethylbenzimidazole phosphoribosyltransferase n=1 Tax=unclassified Acinetobacter TaxID=196816 RepID=UPI0035BA801C
MNWYTQPTKPLNQTTQQQAQDRQNQLTKPTGALGQMEDVVIALAGMQGKICPTADKLHIATFAGDHGIASLGVSAYPQAVTRQMLYNFASGGACISVMARHYGATSQVVDCGTLGESYTCDGVEQCHVAPCTQNFLQDFAMTSEQLEQALNIGKQSVERAVENGADIYIAGEMGIGNTTASSVLAGLLLNENAEILTGLGTGVDDKTFAFKKQVIQQAIDKYQYLDNPLEMLRAVAGFEMVAMVGAYLRAGQLGLPVIVGGFISAVCALCAVRICPSVRDYMLFSHCSAEYGNKAVLHALHAKPLLDLGLRLGEGTGATTAFGIIQLACVVHREMATFADANVSDKS